MLICAFKLPDSFQDFCKVCNGFIIFFHRIFPVSWKNRNTIIDVVMKGEFVTTKKKIPVRGVGIVYFVGKADLHSFYKKVGYFVEFVEAAVFSDYSFGAAIIIS